MTTASRHPRPRSESYWVITPEGGEPVEIALPVSVADEAGALAWWAAHSHELDPEYVAEADLWAALRAERDRRIAATDWTQLPDAPVNAAAWAEYRQALRDLPDATEDPANPEWPTKPESI